MRGREEVSCQISFPWPCLLYTPSSGASLSEIESVKLSLRESSRTERTKPQREREREKKKEVGWKE